MKSAQIPGRVLCAARSGRVCQKPTREARVMTRCKENGTGRVGEVYESLSHVGDFLGGKPK